MAKCTDFSMKDLRAYIKSSKNPEVRAINSFGLTKLGLCRKIMAAERKSRRTSKRTSRATLRDIKLSVTPKRTTYTKRRSTSRRTARKSRKAIKKSSVASQTNGKEREIRPRTHISEAQANLWGWH